MSSPSDEDNGLKFACNAGPFKNLRGLSTHQRKCRIIGVDLDDGDKLDDLGDSDFVPKRRRVDRRGAG